MSGGGMSYTHNPTQTPYPGPWYQTPVVAVSKLQYKQYNNTVGQCLWWRRHERVIARVRPVHLMNVEQRYAAADLPIKPSELDCESANSLLSSTILRPPSMFIISRPTTQPEGWCSFYRPTKGRRVSRSKITCSRKPETNSIYNKTVF